MPNQFRSVRNQCQGAKLVVARFCQTAQRLDAANPPERQSAFQLRRHDQKVNAASFQGTLLALAGFRCLRQNIGVVVVQPAKKGQVYFGRFYLGKRCWCNGDWFIYTKLVQSGLTPLHQSKSCGERFWQLVYLLANSQTRMITRITATMQTMAPVNLMRESRVRSRTSSSAASS